MIKREMASMKKSGDEEDDGIDMDTFKRICPVLLYNAELNGCEFPESGSLNLQEWESM